MKRIDLSDEHRRVVLLDTGGNILWDTRCGPENTDISARDLLSLDDELCLVVGGGLFDTPLAVMIDLNTGEVVEELLMDEWFTLYACEVRGGVPLCLGHNMLCDGADSETYIIGFYSDSDNHFPLRVIGNGACRCRSFVCSDGETIFIGGEMSECWGGHQNIWLVETVPADWGSEDGGSRMNAAFDLEITEGDDWQ